MEVIRREERTRHGLVARVSCYDPEVRFWLQLWEIFDSIDGGQPLSHFLCINDVTILGREMSLLDGSCVPVLTRMNFME